MPSIDVNDLKRDYCYATHIFIVIGIETKYMIHNALISNLNKK